GSASASPTDNQVIITLSSSTIASSDSVTVSASNVSNPLAASPNYVIDESTSSNTTPTATSTYAIVAGPAAQLAVVSGDGQSADTGATFANPLQVALEDAYGNPVAQSGTD